MNGILILKKIACVSAIEPLNEDLIIAQSFMLNLYSSSLIALYCSEAVSRVIYRAANCFSFVSNAIRDGIKFFSLTIMFAKSSGNAV